MSQNQNGIWSRFSSRNSSQKLFPLNRLPACREGVERPGGDLELVRGQLEPDRQELEQLCGQLEPGSHHLEPGSDYLEPGGGVRGQPGFED